MFRPIEYISHKRWILIELKYVQSSSLSFPSYRGTRKFGWKAGDVQRREIPVHSVERLEPWDFEAHKEKITDPNNG